MPRAFDVATVLRCARCGEVIGVYEPLAVVVDAIGRITSIAAEPGVAPASGELFHRACFEPRIGFPAEPRHGPERRQVRT
jgi:hypothetical protein